MERQALVFTYKNHRGVIATRRAVPRTIRFDSTPWHKTPQWLLRAYDLDIAAERDFAMADMHPAPSAEPICETAHAALFALRLLDESGKCLALSQDERTTLARAYACLEAALLGKPKPDLDRITPCT